MTRRSTDPGPAAQQLARAGTRLAALGLTHSSDGNLSMRDGDRILMTPTGSSLGALDPDQLSVLDSSGTPIDGPKPSKEVPLHLSFYRRDERSGAVVHLHSPAATALSCTEPWSERSAVPPITPYFVMRVGQTPLIPYADPGDPVQADAIEQLPYAFRAVLLQNHGCVVAGTDLDSAVDAAIELEAACAVVLAAGSRPLRLLDEATVTRLARRADTPWDTSWETPWS